MQAESQLSPSDREPLFPGRSCFPLSAESPLAYADQLDQLNVIFDVIGTPNEADLEQVDNVTARNYIRALPKKKPIDLSRKFRGADPLAIDLLQKLLHFNPSLRITASEALNHPYLKEMREGQTNPLFQQSHGSSHHQGWDFEDETLDEKKIRALITQEVLMDHPALYEILPPRSKRQQHKLRSKRMNKIPSPLTFRLPLESNSGPTNENMLDNLSSRSDRESIDKQDRLTSASSSSSICSSVSPDDERLISASSSSSFVSSHSHSHSMRRQSSSGLISCSSTNSISSCCSQTPVDSINPMMVQHTVIPIHQQSTNLYHPAKSNLSSANFSTPSAVNSFNSLPLNDKNTLPVNDSLTLETQYEEPDEVICSYSYV